MRVTLRLGVIAAVGVGVLAGAAGAQEPPAADALPETVVLADRLPREPGGREWTAGAIRRADPLTLDALLAADPSFSLYRRQSALFGNPTTSGVSLRRTGATATARTLVLRDGIPQNDPFGGWISWARYDPSQIDSARLVPAAAATAWGNQSPAGAVHLTSRAPRPGHGEAALTAGSHGTLGLRARQEDVSADGTFAVQASARYLRSDGFYSIDGSQRGPVDRRLDLDARGVDTRVSWRPAPGTTVDADVSVFAEERGNGTALARNRTRAADFSLRLTRESDALSWEALAYHQERSFEAVFSSVNDTRTRESPALDQFDVPGSGTGLAWTAVTAPAPWGEAGFGADFRHLRGETNEEANFQDGVARRRRTAGGQQSFAGLFARTTVNLPAETTLDAAVRLDYWRLDNGERIERDPVTGATLLDDRFPARDGIEPAVSLALRRPLPGGLTASLAASTAFRAPTLNELYRPFRVRSDITEANPGLDPERFWSVEAGLAWSPHEAFSWEHAIFAHWIDDAIANVPLTGPGAADALGVFVPPDGSLARRLNVEDARVLGYATTLAWSSIDRVELRLDYLFSDTRFLDSGAQPLLADQPFPQAPRHQAAATLGVRPRDGLDLFAALRGAASAYDDALATRQLDGFVTLDLGAAWQATDSLAIRARIDNLLNEEIQTGLAANGILSTGLPRTFWITAEWNW